MRGDPDILTGSTELSPERRALLAFKALRLKKENGNVADQQTITHVARHEGVNYFPLSSTQERMWFQDQFSPEGLTYTLPVAVRLRGLLDLAALKLSLNEIVRRHEILRTTFVVKDEQPVQAIHPAQDLVLNMLDLQNLPEEERENEARRIAEEEARKPFNIVQGPLIRAKLICISRQDHIMLLFIHHIIFDGWSGEVFNSELTALYRAFSRNQPSPLPPLEIQYADFAVWQRQWLNGETFQRQLAYWKTQLSGKLPVLELPTNNPRPAVAASRGSKKYWKLPNSLTEALRAFSRQENVTSFITLLAAFKTLLFRYTGETDIVIGSPIANRSHREVQGLIGLFLNTMVLRTDLSGNPAFDEALARVRKVTLGAHNNSETPFEKLIQELQPERTLNRRHLLFDVTFALQNETQKGSDLPELTLSPFQLAHSIDIFSDVNFYAAESDAEIIGAIEYKVDLFNEQFIDRMIGHFETLLTGIISAPRQSLLDLPLLTETERLQILDEWNNTKVGYPSDLRVHELFEEQVERTPDRLAALFEQEQITYRELNDRADQLASYLGSLGVGPEVLVGICMNRSLEMLIGVLAVLKAGGAYLPLDPEYPQERLAFMLEDTQVALLLTQRRLAERLPSRHLRVVCLDTEWVDAQRAALSRPIRANDKNLVYIIYTSGSTGRPKGVAMINAALTNLISWQCQNPRLAKGTRRLQFASLSFDPSFREIFSILSSGGTLLMVPEDLRRDMTALARFIEGHAVEKILAPFTVLQQLVEELINLPQFPLSLRDVATAGEQLRITPPIENLFRRLADYSFHNHYGPSETHMMTAFTLEGPPDCWPTLPPIGRPISNTRTYILNPNLAPVPIGIGGEIYIGGVCLARGYFNRPALTAERFIPDPFSGERGARMYKTGDLARHSFDGNIEFSGRTDHQVKLRGYRIELSEIETVLAQHPDVKEAVVIAHEEDTGQKRLIAYVVANQGALLRIGDLRRFLGKKLPNYMLPSAFLVLDALPLTPNGKFDRRAVPIPDASRPEIEVEYIAPRSPVEGALAEVWSRVLKIKQIGIHDNFIELGGDSILSFQVISLANQKGINISFKHLFDHPTIAELALLVEGPAHTQAEIQLVTAPQTHLAKAERLQRQLSGGQQPEDFYPLSSMQQGMLFHCLYAPSSGEYIELSSFASSRRLNVAAFERAWSLALKKHTILRTAFVWEELDEPLQVVFSEVGLPLERHDLRRLRPSEQEAHLDLFIQNARTREFNLKSPPLMRLALFRLSDDNYQFVWSHHHLLLDGWSRNLLLNEVNEFYQALDRGEEVRLDEEDKYRDYIDWLRQQDLTQAENYWRRAFHDFRTPTTLAVGDDNHTDISVGDARYEERQLKLPAKLTAGLRQMARRGQLTMNTLALGAWALLLSRYGGEQEVIFGSVLSGRTEGLPRVERMVGLFINTLPAKIEVAENKQVLEWLKEIQAKQAEVRQYEYSPLVEAQRWSGAPRGTRLFESLLTFANFPESRADSFAFVDRSLQGTGYPIDIVVKPGRELSIKITYRTNRYTAAEIDRALNHFRVILGGMLSHTKSMVRDLPMLTAEEERQLLVSLNSTQTNFPLDQCFHQLFEAQVEKTPEAVAVVCEEQGLSYLELNRQANRLAHALVRKDIGPETIVALFAERSITFLTAMLGVFKAGGSYLPLDPRYPARRISDLLDQSGASLLLYTSECESSLRRIHDNYLLMRPLLAASVEELIGQALDDRNLSSRNGAGDLAYVIYTSGSTGRPKGAMVEQRGMLNHLSAKVIDLKLTSADTIAQNASQCFDISVWQFLAALLVGGRTHIFRDEVAHDPSRLLDQVVAGGISLFEIVPSLLRSMLEDVARRASQPPDLAALRWIISTGEALPPELCREWFNTYTHIPLLNAYGPTECSDDVTHHMIFQGPAVKEGSVPIGRPVANTRIYLLDSQLRPAPIGVTGELFVGGDGVGRGYLNDPSRTAEVFIADPFVKEAGARLYRTGDRARCLPDGTIEFLGRLDYQIKARGHRIELGEIEVTLSKHPGVSEAVVVGREDLPGDTRIAAYIVPRQGHSLGQDDLRRYVGERLPYYMAPSAFVFLDALPLTPNGKVARHHLPPPTANQVGAEGRFKAPRNSTEEILVNIWSEVLGVERVGIHDNFFELGGHSLLATRVVSRVQQILKLDVTLRSLFDAPTVAGIAEIIERSQIAKLGTDRVSQMMAEINQLTEEEVELLLGQDQK
jgi:amino acid adenylation domain-containing protein